MEATHDGAVASSRVSEPLRVDGTPGFFELEVLTIELGAMPLPGEDSGLRGSPLISFESEHRKSKVTSQVL